MQYFKNAQIAKLFKVSKATAGHWIKQAETGKLNLELIKEKNRNYIANSTHNFALLKILSDKGKKFRNQRVYKEIRPSDEFYRTYTDKQIIDIISNLDIDREIPHKYCYASFGAKHWDEYIKRNIRDKTNITINRTIEALELDEVYLSYLLKNRLVNVIDIGPGNGYPVKNLINTLIKTRRLNKYIGVDISQDMLDVAENNFKDWFGKEFPYEGHALDINNDSIQELIYKNTFTKKDLKTNEVVNLILFIGSTIENQRKYDTSLNIIKESMGKDDIFVLGQMLDTEESRIHLSYNSKDTQIKNSDIDWALVVVNLLNLDESLYDIERVFDQKEKARVINIIMKYDLDIHFETQSFKHIVRLNNKEKIKIFRHNHHTTFEVVKTLHNIGFGLLHATVSEKQEQALFMFKRRLHL